MKLNRLDHLVVKMSEWGFIKSSLRFFILFSICIFVFSLINYCISLLWSHNSSIYTILSYKLEILEYNWNGNINLIYSAQATLVGLVYPIIIGFMSILLQTGESYTRFKIYLSYSGAKLIGVSYLLLLITITILYFIGAVLPDQFYWTCLFISYIWFVFNILGTIYFVSHTIEFMKADKQYEVISQYTASIIWINYLRQIKKKPHDENNASGCGVHNFIKLNLKALFKFLSHSKSEQDISIKIIFSDLSNKAVQMIEQQSASEFKICLSNLSAFSKNMLEIGHYINEKNIHDNYALSSTDYFLRTDFLNWISCYLNIFQRCIDYLEKNAAFFGDCTVLPLGLIREAKIQKIPQLFYDIYGLSWNIFYQLEVWWSNEIEKQGNFDHSFQKFYSLRPPYFNQHNQALTKFVSMWENMSKATQSIFDNITTWGECIIHAGIFQDQLQKILDMLRLSIFIGDKNASRYLTSVLQNWLGKITPIDIRYQEYFFTYPEYINISCLTDSFEDVSNKYLRNDNAIKYEEKVKIIFHKIISNYWKDCALTLFFILTKEGKEIKNESEYFFTIFLGLLNNTSLASGDDYLIKLSIFNSYTDGVKSFLRQELSGKYMGLLDSVMNAYLEYTEYFNNRLLTSRVYERKSHSLYNYLEERMFALCVLNVRIKTKRDPFSTDKILINLNYHDYNEFLPKFNRCIETIEQIKFVNWKELLKIIYPEITLEKFEEARKSVKEDFISLRDKVQIISDDELKNAEIINEPLTRVDENV